MNVKGGLRLKRELAAAHPHPRAIAQPVAQVWVDSGVFHLDSTFSYLVPEKFSYLITVGSLVSLPFHGRELLGVVTARCEDDGQSGLKEISKPIGAIPLLSGDVITLIERLSQQYAAHPFDLIRSAMPHRVAAIEKEFDGVLTEPATPNHYSLLEFLQLPPGKDRTYLLARKIGEASAQGGVIAVLPDTREVARVAAHLQSLGINYVALNSDLPRSEQFRNFLLVRTGAISVVLGTRSSVFAPVHNLRSILIYNEGSESLYEMRAPGWNARTVAMERSKIEGCDLIFVGYSPSTEVAKLIDDGTVKFKGVRARIKVESMEQIHGEFLPSRAITPIREAIKEGPVLFVVPLKGYAQAIRCSHCKTISRCECGGAHEQRGLGLAINCNHCGKNVSQWRCRWCNSESPAVASKGITRHQQELGALFPGHEIVISTSDHPISDVDKKALVIATPHMAPLVAGGYSAVVILDGNRFLAQPDLRAQERVREMYFSHIALARSGAPIILIQDRGHLIHNAIATWNPKVPIQRDLEERSSLHLPPYTRVVKLVMESNEITRMKGALESARAEKRLPSSISILGPIEHGDKSALILSVATHEGELLISSLHEFMRRRSTSKKSLPILRIDPYSLSR